ncbi:MAG TPA: M56 family metallopeptidase, partial [Tepidisphaeraceae bacterium]|nr:M56 family metallopeptidase [Tepidisphaeraceae bacterium]
MNTLNDLLTHPVFQRLGWALVHSLWQGAGIALLAAIVLAMLARRSSQARYVVACMALALMAITPIVTFFVLPGPIVRPDPIAPAAPVLVRATGVMLAPMPQLLPTPLEKPTLAQRLQPLLPACAALWIIGIAIISARHVGGWVRVQQLRNRATPLSGEPWDELMSRVCERLGVKRVVKIAESALVQVPSVVGYLKPIILLPVCAMSGLSPQQLEGLIAHELAHVRRHDYLVNLVQIIVETLLFYHPAAWWLSRRIRQERENCCDDLAAGVCPNRVAYVQALAAMEELRMVPGELVLAARGGSLLPRVRRLLGVQSPRQRSWSLTAGIVVVIVALTPLLISQHKAKADETASAGTGSSTKPSQASSQPSQSTVVSELIKRSRSAVAQGKYEEARAILDQVLVLDPKNEYASGVIPLLKDRISPGKYSDTTTFPTTDPGQPDADTKAALARTLPQVNFDKVALGDVIDFLRDITTTNIVVDWKALESVKITRDSPVTVRVREVSFQKALQLVLDSVGDDRKRLGFTVDDNVIQIGVAPITAIAQSVHPAVAPEKVAEIQEQLLEAELAGDLRQLSKYIEMLKAAQDKLGPNHKDVIDVRHRIEQLSNRIAQLTGQPQTTVRRATVDPQMKALLDKQLPEVNFEAIAFGDVIDFLRDITVTNIFVNWRSLEAAGIDKNAPVTIRLQNVAFGKVLDLVLESVGGGDNAKLAWTADQGVISISVAQQAQTTPQAKESARQNAAGPTTAPTTAQVYRAVRIVVGTQKITLEGKKTTWEDAKKTLLDLPNRSEVVLEVAVASDEMTLKQHQDVITQGMVLANELKFKYLSDVGVQPLGSKAGDPPTTQPSSAPDPRAGDKQRVGEYYVTGEVKQGGVYSLTGRTITLMQALIAAGITEQGKIIRVIHTPGNFPETEYYVAWKDLVDRKPGSDRPMEVDDQVIVYERMPATLPASTREPARRPPLTQVGEYYMGGHIKRPGVY